MCLAQGPQRSNAGEAQARGPSVSRQALYHWATALPHMQSVSRVGFWGIFIFAQAQVWILKVA